MKTSDEIPRQVISSLESWWDQDNMRRRQALLPQASMPSDPASWIVMANFFGVVGMADQQIRTPKWINPEPIVKKYLELRQAEKKKP